MIGTGVLLVVLLVAPMPDVLSTISQTLMRPFTGARAMLATPGEDIQALTRSKSEILAENKQLKAELESLQFEVLVSRLLRSENKELKSLLGRDDSDRLLFANVIRRPPESLYDTLVLDVGEEEQVVVGDIVIAHETIIGVVRKVLPETATAVLFSSPGEELRVIIGEGASSTPAIAEGLGGGNYIARVPRDIAIQKNALIRVPTHREYVFAEVTDITSKPTDAFQSVRFRSPVNFVELLSVAVLLSNRTVRIEYEQE